MTFTSTIFFACSTCFGDPSSLSSKGLLGAIWVLGGVITCVLACIAWTAYTWARRAKKLEHVS